MQILKVCGFLLTSNPGTSPPNNQNQGPPQEESRPTTSQEANGNRTGNPRQPSSDAVQPDELSALTDAQNPASTQSTQVTGV